MKKCKDFWKLEYACYSWVEAQKYAWAIRFKGGKAKVEFSLDNAPWRVYIKK